MEQSSLNLLNGGGLGDLGALQRAEASADVTQVSGSASTSSSSALGLNAPVIWKQSN